MGAVPIMSSLTPTKNNKINDDIKNLKFTTAPLIKSYSTGNHKEYEKTMAPNMTTPPKVGILQRCIFRSSVGESTKFLSFATLISDGMANSTTKNAVKKPKTKIYISLKIDAY